MRIAFFAPHKPIDHKEPSGDLMIGRGLYEFLKQRGHDIEIASRARLWKITGRPQNWPAVFLEYRGAVKRMRKFGPDLWLTYHSYHKSPDLFGPVIAEKLKIPYVIYQGVFATKHRRCCRTWPGYMANRKALIHADHVFANKEIDYYNLSRIVLPEKLTRTYPGIIKDDFSFCSRSREEIRNRLGLKGHTAVMSTAMLREDVKAESMADMINAFALAAEKEPDIRLFIAGDGRARKRLEKLAAEKTAGKTVFLGKIPRQQLYKYYSAADIFAFPGINEALGMVYLEAQAAGLPVIAYSTRGPCETVEQGKTGLLSGEGDLEALATNLLIMVRDKAMRKQMGMQAVERIGNLFDLNSNLLKVETQLLTLI